jgi:hypothetical protein
MTSTGSFCNNSSERGTTNGATDGAHVKNRQLSSMLQLATTCAVSSVTWEERNMAGLIGKRFDAPDETRNPDKTTMDVVDLDGVKAARIAFQPGWRWSECIKPVVGGDSCQAHHVGMIASGRMHVIHDDGSEMDIEPGSAYVINPGHDAWVVGDDPVVAYEFDSTSAESYARPS